VAVSELDVGRGMDVSVAGRAGDQLVISVKSRGATGRLWGLLVTGGSCDVAKSVQPGTSFGQPGREVFTVQVHHVPAELHLVLQAPWSEAPEEQYRINIERSPDEA
jgi:hypothetical protein